MNGSGSEIGGSFKAARNLSRDDIQYRPPPSHRFPRTTGTPYRERTSDLEHGCRYRSPADSAIWHFRARSLTPKGIILGFSGRRTVRNFERNTRGSDEDIYYAALDISRSARLRARPSIAETHAYKSSRFSGHAYRRHLLYISTVLDFKS